MSLEINHVARLVAIGSAKEMIESHFEQGGERGISGEMSADTGVLFVLAMNHRHRIPADQRLDSGFHLAVAGIGQLLLDRNRVLVRSVELGGRLYARFTRSARECCKQLVGPARTLFLDYLIKGLEPFGNFALIRLHRLGRRNWVSVHNHVT